MNSQKICIIGGSLTGLVTAIALSKLNCDIDLITDNTYQNIKNNRTIAISENNLNFLKKINISKNFEEAVWPCSIMKLYTGSTSGEFSEIFDFDRDIYGNYLTVEFLAFIRGEKKFENFDLLIKQINRDIQIAKDYHLRK